VAEESGDQAAKARDGEAGGGVHDGAQGAGQGHGAWVPEAQGSDSFALSVVGLVDALEERRADGTTLTGTFHSQQTAVDGTGLGDEFGQVAEPGQDPDVGRLRSPVQHRPIAPASSSDAPVRRGAALCVPSPAGRRRSVATFGVPSRPKAGSSHVDPASQRGSAQATGHSHDREYVAQALRSRRQIEAVTAQRAQLQARPTCGPPGIHGTRDPC
jgi:hypothetical protein